MVKKQKNKTRRKKSEEEEKVSSCRPPMADARWMTKTEECYDVEEAQQYLVRAIEEYAAWLRNKNRLSSTTCGEELQKVFKD